MFVTVGVQHWSVFNPVTNEIELHDHMAAGDAPLADLAAVQTYLKGGIVYAVKPDKVPGGTSAAAMLQY